MLAVKTTTLLFALYAAQSSLAQDDHGEEAAKEMGPVAFMWPPDREWGAAQDNHPPCGSAQSVVERTDFPLRKYKERLLREYRLIGSSQWPNCSRVSRRIMGDQCGDIVQQ